ARRDANLAGQRIEDGRHARDRLQLLFKERPKAALVARGELGGQRAMARLEIGHHAGKADAGIAFEDLVVRQRDAAFGEAFAIGPWPETRSATMQAKLMPL